MAPYSISSSTYIVLSHSINIVSSERKHVKVVYNTGNPNALISQPKMELRQASALPSVLKVASDAQPWILQVWWQAYFECKLDIAQM